MSMKRCFELSAGPSFSAVGRAMLMGGVLSLAVACARKDAAKTDSTVAASDSATNSASAMTTPSATPVESASTGETSMSADSQAKPNAAPASDAAGSASTSAKPEASTKTSTATTHHVVHHAENSTPKHVASSAAPASSSSSSTGSTTTAAPSSTTSTSTSTASAASADTGEKTPADTSKKTASASGSTDHLLVSPQEYEGWKMFSVYCYRCHGVDAMGGGIAPNLRHSVSSEGSVTHEVFIQTVTNGRLDKGMPTWKALLSPEQMEDLWLYINARSSGRLAPGRPHMASGANP
jgi:cytochrome c